MKGYVFLPLSKGKWATVDLDCPIEILQSPWYCAGKEGEWYAIRNRAEGRKHLKMHQAILGLHGELVDHKNRDGLDNRRENLRRADKSQNLANSRKRRGCTSQFKGVFWNKNQKKWESRCQCRGVYHRLGFFQDEIEAAKAYDKKAIELFGEFARPNFS